jgi:assimilatory nitrate reductase catalytic subunit
MGGREVGGLANQLAAHMGFSSPEIDRVRRFWSAPNIAMREGRKAVDMFEAIGRGEIKALWVMGTNPAVSMPDADAARAALRRLDLLVVSENVRSNDTVNAGAHILLPALGWGEKSGTVTNSERRISRQRAFLPAPGEARPDWWALCEVAKRLGFGTAFGYRSAADIFREHAALSGFENDGGRDFDIGALARLSDAGYDAMQPPQWPARADETQASRLFADGGYFTPDRKARFAVPQSPALRGEVDAAFPLRLNTGRIRDQWHTMTRTGLSPRLARHIPEPFVEVHPDDADAAGLVDGGFGEVATAHGRCVLKVTVTDRQQRGMLFAPIHWSEANASDARVGALVAPHVDPHSGQPESKATPAAITPHPFRQRGFVISRTALTMPAAVWWAHVTIAGGHAYLFADNADPSMWRAWLHRHTSGDWADYDDEGAGVFRGALFEDHRLELCVFVGPATAAPDWEPTADLFAVAALEPAQRRMLLSGRTADGVVSAGPTICACFGIGRDAICGAIEAGAATPAEIGARLKAGTNCGSCIPELKRLIAQTAPTAPLRSQAAE